MLCSVLLPYCTPRGGGEGGSWPGLPCCYFSMHQILFMTPGEIYLILTLKRSGGEEKVMPSISSRKKNFFFERRFRLNILAWGRVEKVFLF